MTRTPRSSEQRSGRLAVEHPTSAPEDRGISVGEGLSQRLSAALAACTEYFAAGDASRALEVAVDAIDLARTAGSVEWTRRMLTGYGILQADLHNLPEALSRFESALDYCEELRDPIPYCSVWINIAGTFASAALPDLAVGAAKIAMEYAEGIEDQSLSDHFAAFSLSNIAYAALYSSAYALGLRSARRANTIFRGMPVLAQAPHGQTNIANRINAFCLQARHLLRVGSVSDAKVCVESAKQVLAEFGAPTRATHIATGAEALVLVYAGRIEEGISILDSALANARPLTSEFVVDVLRDLVESNNVANRCEDAALYMHELGRRMQ